MIKNFRYNSSWEDYSKVVAQVEELIKQGRARWQMGILHDFDLDVDEDVDLEYDTWQIILNEILFLIYQGLEDAAPNESGVRSALKASGEPLEKQQIEEAVTLVINKYELAYDTFHVGDLAELYCLKKESIWPKLSEINYNVIERRTLSGKRYQEAQIRIATRRQLLEMPYIFDQQNQQGSDSEISFVCGKDNIDFLIKALQGIKQSMGEE